MPKIKILLFLCCFAFVSQANAYNSSTKVYFNADNISPQLLKNPALAGSKQYEEEVAYIINLQKNPDLKEVDKAFAERNLKPEMVAQFVLPHLTREQYPQLYQLLDRTHKTSSLASSKAKYYWNTKRPYVAVEEIKALIASHSNPAYPSGHTTASYSLAYVLSLVWPKHQENFLDRANEIANHRVLVGMHFPQDLDAGRQLALLVVGGLLQDKAFLSDLEAARKEVLDH